MDKAVRQANNPLQQGGSYSDQDFEIALRLEIGRVAYSLNDDQCRARVAGVIQWCLGVSAKYLYREQELESVSWASRWHLLTQIQIDYVSHVPPVVLRLAFGLKGCLSTDGSHLEGVSWLHQGFQFPIMTLTLTFRDWAAGSGSHPSLWCHDQLMPTCTFYLPIQVYFCILLLPMHVILWWTELLN